MPDTFDDAPPRLDVEGIKERVSCLDVADLLELDVRFDGKTYCWHGEEQTPSLHLYDDHWWCYRCGRGGDIIDMVIQLTDTTWVDAVRTLEKGALRADPDRVVKRTEASEADPDALLAWIDANRAPWDLRHDLLCARRGYPADVVRLYTYPLNDGGLAIPHTTPHLTGIKVLHPDGSRTSVPGSKYHGLYVAQWRGTAQAVLCEGESDSWMMAKALDIDVYALPSGAGSIRPEWRDVLEPYSVVHVCMDNDRPGQEARDKLMRVIGWERAVVMAVPQLYKDAREAITAGWEPVSSLTA